MSLIRTFLVVFLVHSALCEESLVHPCKKDDINCLTSAAQNFLEKTCAGVPQFNIKPIDPMPIPQIEVTLDSGKKVTLKNVSVTGLKKLIIHDFKLDTNKKSVVLAMEGDPEIVADIEIDDKKSGAFAAQGKVIPTAKYSYDLVPNEKGVEYFTVGPETLTCDLQGTAQVTLEKGADELLLKDQANADEIKKKLLCSVINPAFHTVIHNLRESAKIYPKTSYFTDL